MLLLMLDEVFVTDLKICNDRNQIALNGDKYKFVPIRIFAPPATLEGDPLEFDPVLLRDRVLLGEKVEPVALENFFED